MGETLGPRRQPDPRIPILALVQLALFALDLALPGQVPLLPYYFIPVVLGSAIGTPRAVGGLTAGALILALLSGLHRGSFPSVDFLSRLLGLAGVAGVALWIAARRIAQEQRLRSSEEHYRLLAENASDVVALLDDALAVRWVSPSLTTVLGWSPAEWIGSPYRRFLADDGQETTEGLVWPEPGVRSVLRHRLRASDGTPHWCEALIGPYFDGAGRRNGWVCSLRAIDHQVAGEQELARRARIDPLTTLLNREEGFRQIERLSGHRPRTGQDLAVLFCDLDQFKLANDTFGHQAGDAVLREVSQRIRTCLRSTDLAARIGGDEMLVALPGVHGEETALKIADKLRCVVREPIQVPGGEVRISLSIGVAMAGPAEPIDELIARADRAMYVAKRGGGDQVIAIPAAGMARPEQLRSA